MSEKTMVMGTPSLVMLPARNYVFSTSRDTYVITIPRDGKYHDLDPEFFPEDAGEFHIFDEKSKVINLHAISKVLFGVSKYPKLESAQVFVPHAVKIDEDKVILVGRVATNEAASFEDE